MGMKFFKPSVSGAGNSAPSMALVGDSRFAAAINKATVPFSTNQVGFPALAQAISGQCVQLPEAGWRAVGGQRVTTGTATSDTWPLSKQVDALIASGIKNATFLMGTNDFDVSLGPVQTVAAVTAEYWAQLSRAMSAGVRCFVCTDPGVRTAEAATTAKARHAALLSLNSWIKSLAYFSPANLRVIDLHGAMVLSTSATASPDTALFFDSVHFNLAGNLRGATEIARVWNLVFEPAPLLPTSNSDNYAYDATNPNKLANSLFLTDSNADGLADGFTYVAAAGITTVHSLPDASSGVGKAQRTVFTAGQAGFPKIQGPDIVANMPNGSRFSVVCRTKVSAGTNCGVPRVKAVVNGGINGGVSLEFGNAVAVAASGPFLHATDPITKTAGMTTITPEVALQFLGAGGATLDIEQFAVVVLP